jgi:catechol-2,3-dioxygenase
MSEVRFQPRRLGHVNLYVSQLERSIAYYEKVCGIELVRIEAAIRAGFHSNGNTHHDIGLIEISKGEARLGRDGKVQIAGSVSTMACRVGSFTRRGFGPSACAKLAAHSARSQSA